MEIPDSGWIESSLLSDQEQDQALYVTDLPPLHSEHSNLFAQTLHQFEEDLQQFPQPEQHQQGSRGGSSGNDASARRVHKADRERLRRDKLNEQFTELASALDPDRPKNDKATILSDSVQELNELRAEVKRLKTEHAALLDESRDLTQEKSELREEKALLKTETEQLQSQLQQRLRLALSWPVDPTLMFPYPVPLPTPPPSAPSNPSSPSSTSSQIPQQLPQIPQMPYLPLPPPYGMHPYATMYANRPPTGTPNVPYFPYFPPHAIVASSTNNTSTVERTFPHYPTPVHAMPGAPPFFPPSDALFKASYQAPPRPREDSTEQPRPESPQQRQSEPVEDATNSSQVESSGVKQESPQLQSFAKSLSPVADVSSDVGYSAAA